MRNIALFAALFSWALSANAALYTVGAGGTHATLQGAVDASLAAPGDDEIRIAVGTFTENLDITPGGTGNILDISGGWNATFDVRGDVRSIIDGGAVDRVMNIYLDTGDGLVFENLTFQNGNASPAAGLLITQYGDSSLLINDCEIINNVADSERSESGGLRVSANEDSMFSLLDSRIANNQSLCSGTVDCREGGMGLQAEGNAQVEISRNVFEDNSVVIASGSALVGGANLSATDNSTMLVEDNLFIGNSISSTSGAGLGIGLALAGDGIKTARRNRVEASIATVPFPNNMVQLSISQWGSKTGILSDTIVVDSNLKGVIINTSGDGSPKLYLVNLTVADNVSTGIQASNNAAGGEINLSNSISVDNGTSTSLGAGVTSSNNLLTGSAGFVDAGSGNYSLLGTSNAVNAGNNSPPGGLGPSDIAGNPRIGDGVVDIGAYEYQSDTVHADGFEAL